MLDAYIINYNQLTCTQNTVDVLKNKFGCNPIILDNNSSYKPLLAWYETKPCEIVRFDKNYGCRAPWLSGIVKLKEQKRYIVTDPDLELSTLPADAIQVMLDGLELYQDIPKVGVSLRIDDLPDHFTLKEYFLRWEKQFWSKPLSDLHFAASIDTTLAVYAGERLAGLEGDEFHKAIRLAAPYSVRHLPWYIDPKNLSSEELYTLQSSEESPVWKEILLHDSGVVLSENKQLYAQIQLVESRLKSVTNCTSDINTGTILFYGDRSGILPYLFRRELKEPEKLKLVCCVDAPDLRPEASRLFTDLPVQWIVSDPFSVVTKEIPALIVIQATSLDHAVSSILRFKEGLPHRILVFIDNASNLTFDALKLCANEIDCINYSISHGKNYLILERKA